MLLGSGAHNHITNAQFRTERSSYPSGDDLLRLEAIDGVLGGQGGINLANPTLDNYYVIALQTACKTGRSPKKAAVSSRGVRHCFRAVSSSSIAAINATSTVFTSSLVYHKVVLLGR